MASRDAFTSRLILALRNQKEKKGGKEGKKERDEAQGKGGGKNAKRAESILHQTLARKSRQRKKGKKKKSCHARSGQRGAPPIRGIEIATKLFPDHRRRKEG